MSIAEIIENCDRLVANYRHIPAPEKILPAPVAPASKDAPLSHARPIPGGVSARLLIRWTAHSPILIGDAGQSGTIMPQCLFNGGPWCLTGSELRAMVKAAYMVATSSAFVPVNVKHRVNIAGEGTLIDQALKRIDLIQNRERNENGRIIDWRTPPTECELSTIAPSYQTIRSVAERTYRTSPVLDWATALFGFVMTEDNDEIWSPPIDHAGQALKSRIAFSFAKIEDAATAELWPDQDLLVPGATPRITFEAGYLRNPDHIVTGEYWKKEQDKTEMAGLKVYPVHDVDEGSVLRHQRNGRKRGDSDTLLRFLKVKDEKTLSFVGEIDCHNLHPCEFGALIWAFTLGQEECFSASEESPALRHNIGHMRGFGFGQITPQLIGARATINPNEEIPTGKALAADEVRTLARECMERFLESDEGKASGDRRDRFLLYKDPAIGNRMVENNMLRRLPGGANPSTFVSELMQNYQRIRDQTDTINDITDYETH